MSKQQAWVSFVWFRIWAQLLYKILEHEVAIQKWRRGRSVYVPAHKAVQEPRPQKAPKPVRRRDGVGRHRHPEPVVVGLFSPGLEKRLSRQSGPTAKPLVRAA